MGNLQSSPSSSNTTLGKKYDVFLSFRGEDTRNCFTSHLYEALRRKQIETFIDNQLIRGDEISPALTRVIKESKISVVIFSKDYASSKWCLRELVEILKCKKTKNQIVIPVFYDVDPSVVRKQTGSFKDSFVKHENESHERVKTWRQALAEASDISGWHSSDGRTDATLVVEIVNDICKKLMSGYIPPDFGELIGLKPRIEQIISSLCFHVTTDVRIIGIWGMGGIGKTTLADAIFNQNSNQFEGVCFIQNVREKLENHGGLVSVRKEIISKVLKDRDLKLDSPTIPPKIKERLNCFKVFIVLDDVDDSLKMETLVKGVDRLGQGSRIIITSRDKQVLRNCHVNDDNIYEVKAFNHHEALQLFCKYAFHENCHNEDRMVKQLVKFINGNPLALKVLGSALYKKSKEEWESVVNKFEPTNLSSEIFDMLKISYEGLTKIQKSIFLDIACFFKGRKLDYVTKILNDPHPSLSVLMDKSLITISSYDTIEMHDLLEEMGRNIVNQESPNEIGKRSRLWMQEDVLCTLENDDGTPEVQGIFLYMIKINNDIHLSPQAFKKMYNLRLLRIYDSTHSTHSKVNFSEGLCNLSKKLRSLIWYRYPLQALPSNYNPNNLVELDLRGSNLERLWEGRTEAPKLRWLNLSGCTRVTEIQGLSKSPLLESINLRDCSSLLDFPQLAQHMKYLVELDLSGSSNLKRLWKHSMEAPNLRWLYLCGCIHVTKIPDLSKSPLLESISLRDCNSLLDFPQLAQHLKNLRDWDWSGCNSIRSFQSDIHFESLTSLDLSNCNNLTKFGSQISGNNITRLDLSGTAIKELHHSISHLNGLVELFLRRCENLETLPSGIHFESLRSLDLSNCSNLTKFPQISGNNITRLDLSGTAIKELPHSIAHLNGLEDLFLRRCKNLEMLPSSTCEFKSLQHLDLSDCSRLEMLPRYLWILKSLKWLSCRGCGGLSFSRLPVSLVELHVSVNNFDHLPQSMMYLRNLEFSRLPVSLVELDLSVNNFDHLPQSMMNLRNLEFLHLDNCNMVVSLIDLPSNLTHLSACDCKQLQSIPNELVFARILNTKSKPKTTNYKRKPAEFIFTNCMYLEETAVGNMLARLVKYTNLGTNAIHPDYQGYISFSFCYPGSEVPKWFRYRNEGSSITFQKAFDPNLKGFAVCTVIAFEKYLYNGDSQHKLGVQFDGTHSDGDQSSPTNIMSATAYFASRNRTLIDSDHIAFGYCYTSNRSWHFGRRLKNYSFEFRLSEESPNSRLKSCGVCPIYYQDSDTDDSDEAGTSGSRFDEEEMEQHPKESENLQTVPIEHIGETSGIRRSRTPNDHLEEEVEPHPKRLNI